MATEGIMELRNRYNQEQAAAQESGSTLPPFAEWAKRQGMQQKPIDNKLASLMMPQPR